MNKQEQAASVAVIGSTSEAYARKEEVERHTLGPLVGV